MTGTAKATLAACRYAREWAQGQRDALYAAANRKASSYNAATDYRADRAIQLMGVCRAAVQTGRELSSDDSKMAKNLVADITNVLRHVCTSDSMLDDLTRQSATLEHLTATLNSTNDRMQSFEHANKSLARENASLQAEHAALRSEVQELKSLLSSVVPGSSLRGLDSPSPAQSLFLAPAYRHRRHHYP